MAFTLQIGKQAHDFNLKGTEGALRAPHFFVFV